MRNNRFLGFRTALKLTICAFLLGSATVGGTTDTRSLQNRIEFIKQRPGPAIEPLPMISVPRRPDSQTVRNPFVRSSTPRDATQDQAIVIDDRLKVLRIMRSRAIVGDGQDTVYVFRQGDQVGNARVEMISQAGVMLRHPDGSTSMIAPEE